MQTNFTPEQLADPEIKVADKILRSCVHCGFCTATCPTYVLLGDELDSPRGRIYLIKDMLENDKPANEEVTLHIDRCLSCLACMTTCPSGVDYMHLVDQARARIEETYERPVVDRWTRALLAAVLPDRKRFHALLVAAAAARPFAGLIGRIPGLKRYAAMLALAPSRPPSRPKPATRRVFSPQNEKRARVALLRGCAQSVLDPGINEAAIRVLTRHGVEVVIVENEGCCGALVHHMGRSVDSHEQAKGMVDRWMVEVDGEGLDAIVITASGCGTTIKDYGFMLRLDPDYADKASRISSLAKDITEFLDTLDLGTPERASHIKVAYHAACSLQHGQQITVAPKALLAKAGFDVREPVEAHLCCGSAGTYNMLQPEISGRLRDRKIGHLEATAPDIIAAGNIGCLTQIAHGTEVPVIHTVELLDWAYGGPTPPGISDLPSRVSG